MALTDNGHMFIWGRCSNGRMGFSTDQTINMPHEIQLPGGAERWHPICIAAGGRHSMCMALPRHTVADHERRLTTMSGSFKGLAPHASLAPADEAASPSVQAVGARLRL
jgi:Regulator of chromosome condensation (RCC1) repeat